MADSSTVGDSQAGIVLPILPSEEQNTNPTQDLATGAQPLPNEREKRIEDLYLVQNDACLLRQELVRLADEEYEAWHSMMSLQWANEDQTRSLQWATEDQTRHLATGAQPLPTSEESLCPWSASWIAREVERESDTIHEQRRRSRKAKRQELRNRVDVAWHAWKDDAEKRAWAGERVRRPGEERLLEERSRWLREGGHA